MILQSAWQLSLDFLGSSVVVVQPSAEQVSSDAGLLPFRQLDERLAWTRQFAAALTDRRQVGYVGHTFLEMTRSRIYGILADYADQNDHDVLRSDPIFKLICGRSIDDEDLASQPTLSRFENAIGPACFGLQADRLSDHRYFANLFRLYLHAAAYNLLVRMRQIVADPPPAPQRQDVPTEALTGSQRRQYHNHRREHDPLGEGQPCTWRTRLIKVAARVRQTTRRVLVELSSSWPYLKHFQQVGQRVLETPTASFDTG